MYIITHTTEGQEYMRKMSTAIKCRTKKEAEYLAKYFNEHPNTQRGNFALSDGEKWAVYNIDKYDAQPMYRTGSKNGNIVIKHMYY